MQDLTLKDFDYDLPSELIAQYPCNKRGDSRMMVIHRETCKIEHKFFQDIPSYIHSHDQLVFNNSKVLKARIYGRRSTGGEVECLVLSEKSQSIFECLIRSSAKNKNLIFQITEDIIGEVLGVGNNDGTFLVQFKHKGNNELIPIQFLMEKYGSIPLPPYICRDSNTNDEERYQTVYSQQLGSVAAPTAGLHFTNEILGELIEKNVGMNYITLHVGLGTFRPIQVENIFQHEMHSEYYFIDDKTAENISSSKIAGKKIFAVGTTSVRCLESFALKKNNSGETNLYIYPGKNFFYTDGLLTNFHQPKSSLLVLVSAFMGVELRKRAYKEAIRERYRFLSYGDCMLVL